MFDTTSPTKAARASALVREGIESGNGRISYQVIQEFFSASAKPNLCPLNAIESAVFLVQVLEPLLAVQSSVSLFASTLLHRESRKLSWYDALIVAAALEAGCSIIYSEDFQHGQQFGRLRVVNPFLQTAA